MRTVASHNGANASEFLVEAYGRHENMFQVVATIVGMDYRSIRAKGIRNFSDADRMAWTEAMLDRIIDTRGCSRNVAKIYMESENY